MCKFGNLRYFMLFCHFDVFPPDLERVSSKKTCHEPTDPLCSHKRTSQSPEIVVSDLLWYRITHIR
jgi:hypothetical protein